MATPNRPSPDTIISSEWGGWVHDSVVYRCTSTTRPTSPQVGMTVYETDTARLMVYSGTTVGWTLPWSLPWGVLGLATISDHSSPFTTLADIPGLSVTLTVPAGRRLRVAFTGFLDSTVGTDSLASYIVDSQNTQLGMGYYAGVGNGAIHDFCAYVATTAGAATYKVRAARVAGSGNGKIGAAPTLPAVLVVEDIGPAGNPS